ncbi:unnamed protein product [Haemonchus placei]|uniref:VOC domain-containing protein n=1 Tax=Haemonchus placei TaxID=6290 RepID=A0A158QL49_HAEPC|nr:unnamed protein product [Haemonchus placei]
MNGLADFHHIEFRVSNALQSSFWYCCCFGFQRFAEKRDEDATCIAIRNGRVIFVIKSTTSCDPETLQQLVVHGDAVKDVAFRVDSIDALEQVLIPYTYSSKTLYRDSDITHTLVEDRNYSGTFLPGYSPVDNFPLPANIPVVLLDHVVQNYPVNGIEDAAEWYKRSMALQRFWSIDDKITTSEFSAMKAWLITNDDQKVQMTLAEAVPGRKGRSQIEVWNGLQQLCQDSVILWPSRNMFPQSYYDILDERLKDSKVELKEDMKKLRELCILMDFDDNGYLLQLFTRPVQDRPTLFIEIIQRRNFNGFGAGNFKALFDAVEREQRRRGTLLVEN